MNIKDQANAFINDRRGAILHDWSTQETLEKFLANVIETLPVGKILALKENHNQK